ncbi:MAG: N-6 DNA methylase [Candidatus Paceibacterota bacterium]|jgi:type I restriction enzyme M protein
MKGKGSRTIMNLAIQILKDVMPSIYEMALIDKLNISFFFLSLYKDKYITVDSITENSDITNVIETEIKSHPNKNTNHYLKLYYALRPIIQSISNEKNVLFIKSVCKINHKHLSMYFSRLVEFLIIEFSEISSFEEEVQPFEITRLISTLVELPKNAKIFNPFAGLASYGVIYDKDMHYLGQEINKNLWILGTLRLMANERLDRSDYVCDDSILNWPEGSQMFDLIVSTPPCHLRFGKKYRDFGDEYRTIEHYLIEKSLTTLLPGGKLIAFLPQKFLYSNSNHDLRLKRFLINEDLIDMIISFPGSIMNNTSIPVAILVVNKKKTQPGKIRFILADRFVEEKSQSVYTDSSRNQKPEYQLKDFDLINEIHKQVINDEIIRIVDTEKVKTESYNLYVPRYFKESSISDKDEPFVKLKDILDNVKVCKELPEKGPFVRIRDLKDEKIDSQLNISDIEEALIPKSGVYKICETCLLLATRWRSLKPTLFHYTGKAIFIKNEILPLRLNESKADYSYVINELNADYVKKQLEAYRIGETIPYIRKEDLHEILIKLPSLAEQRAKIQGVGELADTLKSMQEEKRIFAQEAKKQIFESFSTIKHSLGTPLLNIRSAVRNIENTLFKLNSEWEKEVINERRSITLRDTFDSINKNLEFVHSILESNDAFIDLNIYELRQIDLVKFIEVYFKGVRTTIRNNIKPILIIHPDIKNQLANKVFLKSNEKLLQIAFDIIVNNAIVHAFIDHSKEYKLLFRVSLSNTTTMNDKASDGIRRFNTHIMIEVANNGRAFPNNYTLDKLIRRGSAAGETGNTGLGGYELNEIIKHHNDGKSTLKLITNDFATEYTTTYSFLLPLNM